MTIYFTSGTTGYPKMVEHSHSSFGIGMTSTGRYVLKILHCSDKPWSQNEYVKNTEYMIICLKIHTRNGLCVHMIKPQNFCPVGNSDILTFVFLLNWMNSQNI